jgi:hypothetical protein
MAPVLFFGSLESVAADGKRALFLLPWEKVAGEAGRMREKPGAGGSPSSVIAHAMTASPLR